MQRNTRKIYIVQLRYSLSSAEKYSPHYIDNTIYQLTEPEVDDVLLGAAVGLGVGVQQNVTVAAEEVTVFVCKLNRNEIITRKGEQVV